MRIDLARFCLIVALVLGSAAAGHAQTGSSKTQSVLNSEINQLFPDQQVGSITPYDARQTYLDIVASTGNLLSSNTWSGPNSFIGAQGTGFSPPAPPPIVMGQTVVAANAWLSAFTFPYGPYAWITGQNGNGALLLGNHSAEWNPSRSTVVDVITSQVYGYHDNPTWTGYGDIWTNYWVAARSASAWAATNIQILEGSVINLGTAVQGTPIHVPTGTSGTDPIGSTNGITIDCGLGTPGVPVGNPCTTAFQAINNGQAFYTAFRVTINAIVPSTSGFYEAIQLASNPIGTIGPGHAIVWYTGTPPASGSINGIIEVDSSGAMDLFATAGIKSANSFNAQVTTASSSTATAPYCFSTVGNFCLYYGTGSPNGATTAAEGSIYLRSDAGVPYYNTNGSTGWALLASTVSPTISNLTVTGSFTATGLVTNADLVSPTVTVNTVACTLGSSCTISAAAALVGGSTTITGTCTNGFVLYNNSGVLGCQSIAGGGNVSSTGTPTNGQIAQWTNATTIQGITSVAVANGGTACTSASITCFNNITGFTASGTTGTTSTNLVFSTSPTIASLTVTGAFTATGLVTNSDLVSPTVTVNTVACTLGSSCTITASASLVVGSSTVTSGTTGNILYNNAGTLGNETIASILTAGNGIGITGTTNATISAALNGSTLTNGASGLSCTTATSVQIGCSKPDGTTITVAGGAFTTANITIGSTAMTPGSTYSTIAGAVTLSGPISFTGGVPTLSNGVGSISGNTTNGAVIVGQGSTFDFVLENKNGTGVCSIVSGATALGCTSIQSSGLTAVGAFQANGAAPSSTGSTCSGTITVSGGPFAGKFTSTVGCTSGQTIVLTGLPTMPTGYACDAGDASGTATGIWQQTAGGTTSVTFTARAGTSANDDNRYKCVGY